MNMENKFAYLLTGPDRPSLEVQAATLVGKYNVICDSTEEPSRGGFNDLLKLIEHDRVVELWLHDFESLDEVFKSFEKTISFFSLVENKKIRILLPFQEPINSLTVNEVVELFKMENKINRIARMKRTFNERKNFGLRVGRPRNQRRNDGEIKELRITGLTYREIAQQLGISIGSVQRAVKV